MDIGLSLLIVSTLVLLALAGIQAAAKRRRADGAGPAWLPMTMQVVVTVVLLAAALFIVLSGRYNDGTQKFAFGTIGTIVGFWFKTAA